KTREPSKAWGGEGPACNGMLAAIEPLSTAFESGFLCSLWLRARVFLVSFFETLFDLTLLLRVFFLVMVLTRLACGVGCPTRLLLIGDSEYEYARMMFVATSRGLNRAGDQRAVQ